ncbi:MAG: hypothetical protein HKO63_11965 [Acidimicrobiia bacterium]|nr:hypothetical protein [Acidimicrobiia bacterium]
MPRARRMAVASALAVMVAACGAATGVELEDLGLAVGAHIQAGADFELVVPAQPDTTIEVVLAPPGVVASISDASGGDSIRLAVAVDQDTPRGAYNLALRVVKDGEEYEFGWPFRVIESTDALLTVVSPQIGDLLPSPAVLSGRSSSSTVDYTLAAGSLVLAEGTVEVVDGAFSVALEFTNTCCIEMVLEVFQPGENGLAVTIPVAYPEEG